MRPSSGGRTRRTSVSFAAKSTSASFKVMISVERMVMTREVPSIQWIPLLTTQRKAVPSASCASRSEGCSFKQSSSPHRPVMPNYLEIRLGEPETSWMPTASFVGRTVDLVPKERLLRRC